MIENPMGPIKRDLEAMLIENPFVAPIKRDGKLTRGRWLIINHLIDQSIKHDEMIEEFARACGISWRRLKAAIETYRLPPPSTLQ